MKNKLLLLLISVSISSVVALVLLRTFAPGLFGIAQDSTFVQSSKKVPPFFANIFRDEDYLEGGLLVSDPVTAVRGAPLYPKTGVLGPHDILGFRNFSVPDVVDVITIGDSLTYGNNALISENWPKQLQQQLQGQSLSEYSLAIGGWAATQYVEAAKLALKLQPRVIVLAFYDGNDAIESFREAYRAETFAFLRPKNSLTFADMPTWKFPPPVEEQWKAVITQDPAKSQEMIFTPQLRLIANDREIPAVLAGWEIMKNAAYEIKSLAQNSGTQVVVTLLPTKELVYSRLVEKVGTAATPAYQKLILHEQLNREAFKKSIEADFVYVEVLDAMQAAVESSSALFPNSSDGHPLAEGYGIIAKELAKKLRGLLPPPLRGCLVQEVREGSFHYYSAESGVLSRLAPESFAQSQGCTLERSRKVTARDLAGFSSFQILR